MFHSCLLFTLWSFYIFFLFIAAYYLHYWQFCYSHIDSPENPGFDPELVLVVLLFYYLQHTPDDQ
jgi:hypothetical protein